MSPSANWLTKTADLSKQPVYIVRFSGLTSVQYSSGPVTSASRTTKPYLSDVEGMGQSADPVTGRFSAGTLTFMLTDLAGEVTALLDGDIYNDQRVTLMSGYAGMAETDYLTIPAGFLIGIELRNTAAYKFTCGDPRKATVEDVFTNADSGGAYYTAKLNGGSTAGKHTVSVPTAGLFDALTGAALLNEGDGVFLKNAAGQEEKRTVARIRTEGDEIVLKEKLKYTYASGDFIRWASTRLTGSAVAIIYGMLTGCYGHESSATVSLNITGDAAAGQRVIPMTTTDGIVVGDYYFVQAGVSTDAPQEVVCIESISPGASVTVRDNLKNTYAAFHILFSAPASMRLVSFDGMPTGLGLRSTEVDSDGMEDERNDWLWGLRMSFEVTRAERAKTFMEREIFRLFGYPILTLEGKVGFKAYGPRRADAAAVTLAERDIVSWSWRRRFDLAYNRLVMKYGYDVALDTFLNEKIVEDTANQVASGVRELVIELKGVPATDFNAVYLDTYAKRFLQRYMNGVPELTVQCHLTKRALQIGESVELTHSKIPNVRTAARGIAFATVGTPLYEVVRIQPGLDDGAFTITLQDNGYQRPGFIAPAGQPDYGSASAAQRKFAYISPSGLANFADGTMPYQVI